MNILNFFDWIYKPRTAENSERSPAENATPKISKTKTPADRLADAKQAARAIYDQGAKTFGNVLPEGAQNLYKTSVEARWAHIQEKIFDPLSQCVDKRDFSKSLGTAIKNAEIESRAAIQRLEIDAKRSEIVARRSATDPLPQVIQREDGRYTLIRKSPPIENLVLRGGGAKGISYGAALEQFEESGYLSGLKRIAGSSAGALTATCMACGVPASHFEKVESDKLFKSAITAYWNRPKMNNYPDLEFANKRGVFTALGAVQTTDTATAEQIHGYLTKNWNTATFQDRLSVLIEAQKEGSEFTLEHIAERLDTLRKAPDFQQSRVEKMITFKDLSLLHQLAPETFKELTLTAWGPDNKCSIYFDKEKTPDIPICYAARISMSFPVGFKPVRMDLGDGQGKRTLIDGGVGTNLPAEVFIKSSDSIKTSVNAAGEKIDSSSKRDDPLNTAKTLMFVFDMKGEAYQVMHHGKFVSDETREALNKEKAERENSFAGKFSNWLLGKDHKKTGYEDREKLWSAGPNGMPVFHETIGTMALNISDSRANAARLQAATAALEQLRIREDQAYFSDFASLEELVSQLSEEEKKSVNAYASAIGDKVAMKPTVEAARIAREKANRAKSLLIELENEKESLEINALENTSITASKEIAKNPMKFIVDATRKALEHVKNVFTASAAAPIDVNSIDYKIARAKRDLNSAELAATKAENNRDNEPKLLVRIAKMLAEAKQPTINDRLI